MSGGVSYKLCNTFFYEAFAPGIHEFVWVRGPHNLGKNYKPLSPFLAEFLTQLIHSNKEYTHQHLNAVECPNALERIRFLQ